MNIWLRLVQQADREYPAGARLVAIACGGLIFGFAIPAFLFWISRLGMDSWQFESSPAILVLSLVLALAGLYLILWSAWVQFHYARGTPIPLMPTRKLLTGGPYALCRNPMAMGIILLYSGIATLTASCAAMLAVVLFAILLMTYIKLFEEKEMSLRFGEEYLRYRENIPFIIPSISVFLKKMRHHPANSER